MLISFKKKKVWSVVKEYFEQENLILSFVILFSQKKKKTIKKRK